MEHTECSETSAYKIPTPGNYLEESVQHPEHGESLKSRIIPNYFEHLLNLESATNYKVPYIRRSVECIVMT